jgi:hypothetical protein
MAPAPDVAIAKISATSMDYQEITNIQESK